MTDAKFIRLDPPAGGLDYESLRAQGLAIIERLAGAVWTDHNAHDPGITTLEQLCYALTELCYRAQSPIEDLLTVSDGAPIDARGQALFAPPAILSSTAVTANDYRKLIADRVPGVENVWLSSCRAALRAGANGFCDIEVYAPDLRPADHAAVRRRVRRVYTRHRGLCEDLHEVRVLAPVRAVLTSTLTIEGDAAPETVLASVFHSVGTLLAPELRRESLQALLDAGETPASIFVGPALHRGFVSDDQLGPRAAEFTLSQITQCLLATAGVAAVRDVSLAIDDAAIGASGPTTLAVPRGGILRLDTTPAGDRYSVRLVRGGVECTPASGAVTRELLRLRAGHRRRFDVRGEVRRLLAMPPGRPVDAGKYVSIQEQYPAVYGINRHGLEPDAPPARRAQARQFKAYLLAFEQLLADSFAMLDGLPDLCAIGRGARQRTLMQYLDACDATGTTVVPDVGPILADGYRPGLAALARDRDRTLDRRNRFLDFVLATYGETLDPMIAGPLSPPEDLGSRAAARRLRAKLRMLRHLPRVGRNRGRGSDYLSRRATRRTSGLELAARLHLGFDLHPSPFAQLLERLRVSLRDAAPPDVFALMRLFGSYIDDHFAPLPPGPSGSWRSVRQDAPLAMTEEQLVAACDLANYRIGTLPDDPAMVVVCRAPGQPAWQLVGRYGNAEAAVAEARRWHQVAHILRSRAARLYVVEHVLLRGGASPRMDDEAAGFDYSLTATAVVCLPGREANDAGYREYVRAVVRRNTPAHVAIQTAFLRLRHAIEFERLHAEWQQKLRGDRAGLDETCRALRDFLVPSQS